MALTMEISPNAEAHLRLLAAQQGEEESSLAARLLTELLTEDEADHAASVAVLRTSLADLDTGDRGYFWKTIVQWQYEPRKNHRSASH